MIGKKYHYPNSNQSFVLKAIKGFIDYFECGHWCTDCVFEDLLPVDKQLKLEF